MLLVTTLSSYQKKGISTTDNLDNLNLFELVHKFENIFQGKNLMQILNS